MEHEWQIEPGTTMFHLLNAHKRAAHDKSLTADEAYKMECIGRLILSMARQGFSRDGRRSPFQRCCGLV